MPRLDVFKDKLSGTTPEVIEISPSQQLPITVTLKSGDAGRGIEFSTDGGTEYFTPTYDVTTSTMVVVVSECRLSHIRLTGTTNDQWSVR